MEKSDSIIKMCEALVEAQSKMPAVKMNKKNPFLKNNYADLGAIIETSQPILAENGLAISQICTSREGYIGVETVLLHKSGEWISSTMELPTVDEKGKSNAQVAGSIITYIRRYSLAAILGMYADEDVDGNGPVNITPPKTITITEELTVLAPINTENATATTLSLDAPEMYQPEDSETIIPASVIEGIKTPWDALDKIMGFALQIERGKDIINVITKYDKNWTTEKDVNKITETRVIKIVNDLTGYKYDKEG